MTFEQFQRTIKKQNGFDRILEYIFSLGIIGAGVFFFYDITANSPKYEYHHTYPGIYVFAGLMVIGGYFALRMVANRYKILTVKTQLSLEEQKQIIQKLQDEYGAGVKNSEGTFYVLSQKASWWRYYDIYLTIDSGNFYVAVIGVKTSGNGFIDFGQTERLRKKNVSLIELYSVTNDTSGNQSR